MPIYSIICKKCDWLIKEKYFKNYQELEGFICPNCGSKGLWQLKPAIFNWHFSEKMKEIK